MSIGTEIRAKRTAAGIAGVLVCAKAGIARSRLSDIERGYVKPPADEIARSANALDDLTRAKRKIAALAAEEGWPSSL
jgi:transcriptional regulator with XRE-family HTH domain